VFEAAGRGSPPVHPVGSAIVDKFMDMHKQGCFVLPNAWDVGSARILESVGFAAIATTSAGVAFSLGRTDHGYAAPADRVGRDTMMRRVGDIAAEVSVPVSADLENGYGDEPEAVAATIAMAVQAGAAGAGIEDFTGSSSRPLYDLSLAVERISAARAAAPGNFVLVGRSDGLLAGQTLDECVKRSNAYLAAGADCAFVPGAADAETIGLLVREINGPLNVVMGLSGSPLTLEDLAALGVRRVTVGGSIIRAMYRHLLDAARELAGQGTFTYARDQISQASLNEMFRRSG
jgi:2-methylisocitrate lyase-like PEP mutase family enzyme